MVDIDFIVSDLRLLLERHNLRCISHSEFSDKVIYHICDDDECLVVSIERM